MVELEREERPRRVRNGLPKQRLERCGEPLDPRTLEQIRRVDELDEDSRVADVSLEREVEAREAEIHRDATRRQAVELERRDVADAHTEVHLEQRVHAGTASRTDRVDDLLERDLLMLERRERRLPHTREERSEGRVPVEPYPCGHRIGEEADHALELAPGTVGARPADENVVLARQAIEKRREHREQEHVGRHALGVAEGGRILGQVLRQPEGVPRRLAFRGRAPRAVRRQLQERGSAGQMRAPERQLLLVPGPGQPRALPAREVAVLQRQLSKPRLIGHENVVAVYAVEEQPIPYIVMEFVSGSTLQQHIDQTGPLELPEILRFSKQIALGLEAAHATGMIHRDIKPGNILLEAGPEPKVKITDFGLARAADDASLTQSGTICGTPMYMSPEQAMGKPVDPRSDLFSLGSAT